MGKLLCEKKLRDVWCRNESVRAEIGPILQTHTHTHAAKLVVEITYSLSHTCNFFQMFMQINGSKSGHLQKGALCPMLLYQP